MAASQLPDKLFFKIGEVADLVGVKAHVLRYWESEFRELSPMKTRGAHRMYRRRDVELALIIERLLHREGYSIAGAKRKLREMLRGPSASSTNATAQPAQQAERELALRAELLHVRNELRDLLAHLDRIRQKQEAPQTVTVQSVALSTVPAPLHRGHSNTR